MEKDKKIHARTLTNIAGNPNIAATLVIGLGCEPFSAEEAVAEIEKFGKPVRYLNIQEVGGTLKTYQRGIEIAQQLTKDARKLTRRKAAVSDLVIGVECGGSDAASGLTANAALGRAVDRIVDGGGTAIIGETDEFIGAEMIVANNASGDHVRKEFLKVVGRFEAHVRMYGIDLSTGQPTRGNIEAGLTTIEEKSLGCIRKIGSRPIVEVLEYAEVPSLKGPVFMDTPGFDVTSITGLAAGGCQVIVFTTGLGTPVGIAMVPVIKVASNTITYRKMKDNIDINAGTIIDGIETVEQVAERIYRMILRVCNGYKTKAEILGENQFAVWQATTQL